MGNKVKQKLFTVYLYIMFNFELYITYSEIETKGVRDRGRKKKNQNKKKKEPTKLNVTLLSPEGTFCIFYLTIKWQFHSLFQKNKSGFPKTL